METTVSTHVIKTWYIQPIDLAHDYSTLKENDQKLILQVRTGMDTQRVCSSLLRKSNQWFGGLTYS